MQKLKYRKSIWNMVGAVMCGLASYHLHGDSYEIASICAVMAWLIFELNSTQQFLGRITRRSETLENEIDALQRELRALRQEARASTGGSRTHEFTAYPR